MKKIILASGSPRRKELLTRIGLKFEIDVSKYEEDMTLAMSPFELVKFLSLNKGREVAPRHKESIIISADTIVVLDDKVLGKPKDADEAIQMLVELQGRAHEVMTGFTIIDTATNKTHTDAVISKVHFRELNDNEIKAYVATGEPLDKAGSYGIQDIGSTIVERIEGDYFNIVGLPICALALKLKDFGINIL